AGGRLDETAQRRLRVIEDMTELGAGFRLAMRDLEIRGSGNLLGAEQHGHIAAVGFDLYTKLLAEAVRELKGEPVGTTVDPVITVGVEALLPDAYIPEVNQRLAIYQRLTDLDGDDEITEMRRELADRFGPPPPPVEALLDVVGLRALARRRHAAARPRDGDRSRAVRLRCSLVDAGGGQGQGARGSAARAASQRVPGSDPVAARAAHGRRVGRGPRHLRGQQRCRHAVRAG